MYLLYDVILLLASVVLLPYALLKGIRHGSSWRGMGERVGFYSRERLAGLQGKPLIWVHAVSVGEVRAAMPLLRQVKEAYPQSSLILSSMTFTGHAIARDSGLADLCVFFPFDLSWVARRIFRQLPLDLLVIVETEIWPNFIHQAKKAGIPIVLVNGRISDRSFPRYKFIRPLLRPVLQNFSSFCMQSETDAQRISYLGAPSGRVSVPGNLKFDMQVVTPEPARITALKEKFRLPEETMIWVAGSTRSGEHEILIEAYRQLVSEGIDVVLVLVPRHVERCKMVGELLVSEKVPYVLRSSLEEGMKRVQPGGVLLVDTMGEMLDLYATADLVFVGGSLVPVGGHNVLEPALLKKPVIFGPYMHNFKEISRLLLSAKGGVQVADRQDLLLQARKLLKDSRARRVLGNNGNGVLASNAGATRKTLDVMKSLMES